MASSSLQSNFSTAPLSFSPKQRRTRSPSQSLFLIRAGPRSNRGPLVKGRILSSEAILALQSLKRAHRNTVEADPTKTNLSNLPNLSRLIKSDLVSVLRELLRQNQCSLALHVLSTLRSEYRDESGDDHTDIISLYADVIFSLAKNKMPEEVDVLVGDVESLLITVMTKTPSSGVVDKGMVQLIRAVVEARRREATVRICGIMRRGGCGDTWTVDEYLVKVLSKGLKAMGEMELASEVEREFGGVCKGNLDKLSLQSPA